MIEYWKDDPELESRLERVAAIIATTIDDPLFPIREAVALYAEPKGKLLRPALLIVGSRFGRGSDPEKIDRLAAAIELLHVATLIHDDIIDEAPLRRGEPSLHARLGTKEAILAGDWLFSRCFVLSSESAEPENARGLSRLIAAICAAEIGQDLAKYQYPLSLRRYFRTIAGKTAALFSLALYAGASEARAGHRVEQRLRRAGYCLGMAFQIIDDILDFESAEERLRKPVGMDLAEGLCTLPLVYALRVDEPRMRRALDSVVSLHGGGASPEARSAAALAAREAASLAASLGGTELARADARRFTERAQDELDRLAPSEARDELARIASRLLIREY